MIIFKEDKKIDDDLIFMLCEDNCYLLVVHHLYIFVQSIVKKCSHYNCKHSIKYFRLSTNMNMKRIYGIPFSMS